MLCPPRSAPVSLLAIEEEHFDQLPGGIFNKGFVRAYARHLGMDENQAIADFVAASAPILPETPPAGGAGTRRPGGAGAGIARGRRRGDDAAFRGDVRGCAPDCGLRIRALGLSFAGKACPLQPRGSRPAKPDASALIDQKARPGGGQSGLPRAASQPRPPQAPLRPQAARPSGTPGHNAELPPEAALPRLRCLPVLIKAREDSWVAHHAPTGKQIIQDTLAAPAEKSIEARDQIVIKTGNVGALEISFNGKKLPPQGAYNQVKTLTFDPNGLRP